MKRSDWKQRLVVTAAGAAALALIAAAGPNLAAQGPQGGRGRGPAGPPPTPEASAAIDLTGYWVSIVNEDWRWRMVTPPKGDYTSVPLNPEGQKMAKDWDESTDGSCMAFGAAALLRMPTRVHITWADPNTLKIETDNGEQTRLLHFDHSMQMGQPSLQGYSEAEWVRTLAPRPWCTSPGRWVADRRHDESHGRVAAPQRCAVQQQGDRDGVLRPIPGSRRRRVVLGDDARGGSDVPAASVRHQFALPQGTRRFEVASSSL